jgi:hypothetical protein
LFAIGSRARLRRARNDKTAAIAEKPSQRKRINIPASKHAGETTIVASNLATDRAIPARDANDDFQFTGSQLPAGTSSGGQATNIRR